MDEITAYHMMEGIKSLNDRLIELSNEKLQSDNKIYDLYESLAIGGFGKAVWKYDQEWEWANPVCVVSLDTDFINKINYIVEHTVERIDDPYTISYIGEDGNPISDVPNDAFVLEWCDKFGKVPTDFQIIKISRK